MHKRHYIITWLLIVYSSFQAAVAQTGELARLRESLPRAGDSLAYVDIMNRLGMYYHLSNTDSCFWYAVKAREIATRLQYKKGIAGALSNLGIVYVLKANIREGIEHSYNALQLYREVNDSLNICRMYNSLCACYSYEGNIRERDYYLYQAMDMARRLSNDSIYTLILNTYIVISRKDSTKQDSVQWALNKARELTARHPGSRENLYIKIFDADELMKRGLWRESEKKINEIATAQLKKGWFFDAIDTYDHIDSLIVRGYPVDNIRYMKKRYELGEKAGYLDLMLFVVSGLYQYYAGRKDRSATAYYGSAIAKLAGRQQELAAQRQEISFVDYFLEEQELKDLQLSSQVQQQAIAQSDLQRAGRRQLLNFLAALLILFIVFTIIYCWSYYASRRYEQRLTATNAEITAKNTLLHAGDDFKNKLLSVIAHDFRAPLSDIIKVAELLKDRSPDRAAMLATIGRAAVSSRRTLDIFDGILRWMKAQLSGFSYVPVRCNIKVMIKEALDGIQQEAAGKQLQTNLEMPDGIMVAADPEMLQFMHHHLLQHIVAFADPGGKVMVTAQQETGRIKVIIKAWQVTVTPGMLHLFEHSRHNEGLALIICRDFMDKMGGSIGTVADSPGMFAFVYTLPSFR